jgi:alkaline phosphatase
MHFAGGLFALVAVTGCLVSEVQAQQLAPTDTYAQAARAVQLRAANSGRARRARNVILFVGDGMGVSTVTAARILDGQRRGLDGEGNRLSFEEFPATGLVRTFTANQQTPDSAPTATAMVTGWLANDGALSVSPQVGKDEIDKQRVEAGRLQTILELAEARGLATGIVTTTRITDATPASTYAHTPNRFWEAAGQLPPGATLADIAAQLLERQRTGSGIEVILAGGRDVMLPTTTADPEHPGRTGRRRDGHNLIEEWQAAQPGSRFVWNREALLQVDGQDTRHLLGLFEPGHLRYEVDRVHDRGGEPSLAEMTVKAIELLRRERKGFFLLVEGGRIDHGHHAGNAWRALTETIALSEAVRAAMQETGEKDTLILVTADHSHTLVMAGYTGRGNPILGLVRAEGAAEPAKDVNGRPYATLSYANGFGFAMRDAADEAAPPRAAAPGRNQDLSVVDTTSPDFHQEALVGLRGGETHAGEDVALYARGPGSELVRGAMNQNEIYHVMRRALGF